MSDNLNGDPTQSGRSVSAQPTAGVWEREVLEKFVLAAVREQRAARRWKIFFRFAFLLVLLVIVWRVLDFSGFSSDKAAASGKHTALVSLDGEISAGSQASARNIISALDTAFADHNTAGVILRINSPGGSPVQAGIINNEIYRLRAKYPNTPIYTVAGDMCASGAYYVAVATDKIFVDKASIVGSIGVLMGGFGFTGLMDKLGVERRLQTSGENKGFYDPFSPETDKMKAHAQTMLDQIHAQFIDAVKRGRGKRLKPTPDMFSGLFWTGQESVDLGLADGLGDTGYVAREIIKADKVVNYTVKENFADRVARKFGAAVGDAAIHAMVFGSGLQLR